jgi:hypothetical protein
LQEESKVVLQSEHLNHDAQCPEQTKAAALQAHLLFVEQANQQQESKLTREGQQWQELELIVN